MSRQPVYKQVGTVGDINPLEYCGGFVFEDTTGVYSPQVEYYERQNDDDDSPIYVYRFDADLCTYIDGILSDNPYHKDYPVWFADKLPEGVTPADFCSADIMTRARAWVEIGMYYGLDELDSYPLTLTYAEAEERIRRRSK